MTNPQTTQLESMAKEVEIDIWEAHPYRKSMEEIILAALRKVDDKAYQRGREDHFEDASNEF